MTTRIAALAAQHGLDAAATDQMETLLAALLDDPHAPTAIRDRAAAIDDHLADSLVALELPVVREARAIADLGSGAGLPALPLAIALPAARVTAVESVGRKAQFIARTAAACGLDNVTVAPVRAEEWRAGLGTCDLVVARALASLAVVAEYAAPLLVAGGTAVVWRGRRDPEDEASGARAAAELGLELSAAVPVTPYPGARHRHLQPLRKVAPTPERFPRRPGMARKRPLGAGSGGPV